jgi:hypothetical protein
MNSGYHRKTKCYFWGRSRYTTNNSTNIKVKQNRLIDWCLTQTWAVIQLYNGVKTEEQKFRKYKPHRRSWSKPVEFSYTIYIIINHFQFVS